MTDKKLQLQELLDYMSIEKQSLCRAVLNDFSSEFEVYPGSITKHQAWKGGYRDHVEEAMNIGVALYSALDQKRKLSFPLGDALFILFLHDLDKLICYREKNGLFVRVQHHDSVDIPRLLEQRYSYFVTPEEINAIRYVHGEGNDYHPTNRVMMSLGAFVHCCDTISARIWFDFGRDQKCW